MLTSLIKKAPNLKLTLIYGILYRDIFHRFCSFKLKFLVNNTFIYRVAGMFGEFGEIVCDSPN